MLTHTQITHAREGTWVRTYALAHARQTTWTSTIIRAAIRLDLALARLQCRLRRTRTNLIEGARRWISYYFFHLHNALRIFRSFYKLSFPIDNCYKAKLRKTRKNNNKKLESLEKRGISNYENPTFSVWDRALRLRESTNFTNRHIALSIFMRSILQRAQHKTADIHS